MIRKTIAAIAAAALLACAPPTRAQTGATGEPIKLGLILDMSSVYADITGQGSATAAEMAVEDFGGSALGRKIEVLHADHQNKADQAAAIAAKWFDVDHVTALMDVAASGTALAAMTVAKERNKIVILNGPGAASITNEACMPTAVHYAYNTYALGRSTAKAVYDRGGASWFFITADYTFGHQLENDTTKALVALGGKSLGHALAPLATTDYSSFLLQAQGSQAKVVGMALSGADFQNAMKQAAEFGLQQSGQRLAGLLVYINDIHALGLKATQGMQFVSAFYWDRNDGSRDFAKRFYERLHKMPNMSQAGIYSSTLHYLNAVKQAGTTDAAAVMKVMRETPINDFFAQNGHIRADGLMVHDMFLFQAKTPAESKGEWDLYKQIATIPGDQAFAPLSESRCPLVKAGG